ncbi:hypothetical protein [Pseudoalteromonas sp. MEBiC 03485]|nr:hypothetical protein [Pseudoalteromonas sp. MEBiC 03485]
MNEAASDNTYDGWTAEDIHQAEQDGEAVPVGVWEQWVNGETDSDLEEE